MERQLENLLAYTFIFIGVQIIGNSLLLALILYEKYCIESQKRTVINLLISSQSLCFILCNICILPIWVKHLAFEATLGKCKKTGLNFGLHKKLWFLVHKKPLS